MAEGDAAYAAGMLVVPDTGNDYARVRWGAREINRTRDYIAGLIAQIPVGKTGFRTAAGITATTSAPSGGADGDIHFKIIG